MSKRHPKVVAPLLLTIMKKSFLAVAAVCLLAASAAQAQDARFTAKPRQPRTTFVAPRETSDGALLRTIRAANPLQMVNPTAPVGYGNGQEVTRHEDSDPYQRPQGIKLVTVEF
jgi:hypothetical protein